MMGIKERAFGPLPPVSPEDLVPPDHFYRHLKCTLDLGFVRDLVKGAYADSGRPSIDPAAFFNLQLILFFEGLRSERQFMRVVADRLSLLWYLGHDLTEPLPDHSSLTRLRDRYGLDVFRRFFEQIVERCAAAGLIAFRDLDEAIAGVTAIVADYGRHRQAARQLAETYLDARRTLPRMLAASDA
jgi:transposase